MKPLEYLLGLERYGIKLGLDNIRTLCLALGDPQRSYATVIVAGTNGKGSVTAMVDRALGAAGLRSARFTSPHLVRLEERFVVDGHEVTRAELERAAGAIAEVISAGMARGELQGPPTFFEATTAVAFEIFRTARVDIAVLEVGLGGRLDATNVAEPRAVAITSIDRDHEEELGNTLASIAFEKAGIIRPNTPVVIGPLDEEPRAVITRVAEEMGAPLVDAMHGVGTGAARADGDVEVELQTPVRAYPRLRLGLRGDHQVANAVVAVRLLEMLEQQGMMIGGDAIAAGLREVRWPGRLEWIDVSGGRLLLDAAHNPSGALSLARYLAVGQPPMPLVFGASRDKDVDGMLAALQPVVSRVIATQAATPRAMAAGEVAARARALSPGALVTVQPDPIAAVADALVGDGRACVAGSIFLVGDVRGRLVR